MPFSIIPAAAAAGRKARRRGAGRKSPTFSLFPRFRRLRWVALLVAALGGVLGMRESELFQPVAVPYGRSLYAHWLDLDGNCRDSRQEALAAQSERPVVWSDGGCRVASGRWHDPYTGATFTDPGRLDVDHVVPLAEAHRSGADRWPPGRRAAFANEPANLIAVDRSANRSKADGDPLAWLPPRVGAWCPYTARFVAIKRDNGLTRDPLERWWTDALLWICDR